jgi:dipeptidyl aminopeptidase/acylaminoacyl peptidase
LLGSFAVIRFLTLFAGLFLLLFINFALAEESGSQVAPVEIDQVLSLGPLPLAVEALDNDAKADEIRRALVMQLHQGPMPRVGQTLDMFGQRTAWSIGSPAEMAGSGLMAWTVNLDVDRFVAGSLIVTGLDKLQVFHGSRPVELSDDKLALKLVAGTHQIWLLHQGAQDDQQPALSWQGDADHDRLRVHTNPERRVSAERLTNAETVGNMALSADGRYLALSFSGRNEAADLDIRRLEIRDLERDRIVRQWTGTTPAALAWSPDGSRLAVQEGNNVWLHELESGQARLLLANHERIGSWRWHPDGGSILFLWTEPDPSDNDKRRRIRSLEDRWSGFRDNTQLYQVDVASGLIRPLSARDQTVTLQDVHPDGDRVLLSERLIDYREPPHSLFRLFELNLSSLQTSEVGQFRLINAALFADDGYWLLAGPGLAQGDGATTGADLVPNEYDTQLYRLDRDGQRARSMSRDFNPALGTMHRLVNGELLLSAVAGERVVLVRFEPGRERFTILDSGVELMEAFVASESPRPVVAIRGTDADAPQRVHLLDVQRNSNRTLIDTHQREYADVILGSVQPWTFNNTNGDRIDGRYYLPPDFDASKKYPLIVYYYGGTTPVNRQFTGRYPFNLWAAKGYVIYVIQPRGTIGYGQEFSALHVNAWGKYTADDIIEGTGRFVEAHDFIDADRIGNIGASYGGFMTMHLATLTDLYAASISHAGISALTSYWGQGWWGYGYSGIASRGSFPWNNPELYVGQSPVYSADRITTPMLLVTGDSDTNVPPGESHNMYTALKLLGREVELIEFPGEDHWILDREKRYIWWDTMLAWFDYWLKDEPEWWHHLYPETAPES